MVVVRDPSKLSELPRVSWSIVARCKMRGGALSVVEYPRMKQMTSSMPEGRRIAIGTLFGVVIFISGMILPTPIDKILIIIQATMLGLSSLLVKRLGATYAGMVAGLLMSLSRAAYAPFSLIFAITYGLLVDTSFHLLRVRMPDGNVQTRRVVASLTVSTAVLGLSSTYVTIFIGFMPMIPILYAIIIIIGIINGVAAGFVTSFIWNRYLKAIG